MHPFPSDSLPDEPDKHRGDVQASAASTGGARRPKGARKGRPRDQESYAAILNAARKLAKEKYVYKEISIEAIAAEAKVSKSTIYRWWDSKAGLLREACWLGRFEPLQEKSLAADLEQLILDELSVQSELMNPTIYTSTVAELVEAAGQPTPDAPELCCPHEVDMKQRLSSAFHRARARGDWRGEADEGYAYDMICGTVFARCTVHRRTMTPEDRKALVHAVLECLQHGSEPRRG